MVMEIHVMIIDYLWIFITYNWCKSNEQLINTDDLQWVSLPWDETNKERK